MVKVAYNGKYGGFGLSQLAYEKLIEWGALLVSSWQEVDRLAERGELALYENSKSVSDKYYGGWEYEEIRTHPLLIRVIEELGDQANGPYSKLKIDDISDYCDWSISYFDGLEEIV